VTVSLSLETRGHHPVCAGHGGWAASWPGLGPGNCTQGSLVKSSLTVHPGSKVHPCQAPKGHPQAGVEKASMQDRGLQGQRVVGGKWRGR
jgi:hypothetical protein